DRHADVEADAVAAEIAFLPPAHVAFHLVAGVETAALVQAIAEAERHRGVIRPLAGVQAEGSATHHVRQWTKAAARLELDGGADGVARSQAKQAAAGTILWGHQSLSFNPVVRSRSATGN